MGPGDAILTGCGGTHWITAISQVRLDAGEELGPRHLDEVMLFVGRGRGRARTAEGEDIELREEMALTLLQGELLHVEAGDGGLVLYVVEIGVGST